MASSLSIPVVPPPHTAMDYAALRAEGIRHIARLADDRWSDHNSHDPGITILEQLCYAITDLGYRINHDMRDLLAAGEEPPANSLYTPAEILGNHPVTPTDLRKVVIDVPGVKNAWIEPDEKLLFFDPADQTLYPQPAPQREELSLRGIYRVLIEGDGTASDDKVTTDVGRRLHACRSLCEDFEPPKILPPQRITITADIEIAEIHDPNRLLAEIQHALASFISPRIRFYSLPEMLERGVSVDAIFEGPLLEHGFIDSDELDRSQRRTSLRTSDLVHVIMDVDGVVAVRTIQLHGGASSTQWYLDLDSDTAPSLDVDASNIQLFRGQLLAQPNHAQVRSKLGELQAAARQSPPRGRRDLRLPDGKDRDVANYYSIQHQFPAAYGIGHLGLPPSASVQRQAEARQLKAYLLILEQLLADYFSQLGNVNKLFSVEPESKTYFSQPVDDPSLGLNEIRLPSPDAIAGDSAGVQPPAPSPEEYERKNRFLNHLMARFAEEMTAYSLLMQGPDSQQQLVEAKCAFLKDYSEIGGSRGRAFNYSRPSWDTDNVSGLEKLISRKLGLSTYRRRELAGLPPDDEGGFHMIEHILLRPDADQASGTAPLQPNPLLQGPIRKDPYSHQVSFVFPDWITRFQEKAFQALIKQLLRDETPAHQIVHLHWLDQADMREFESAYQDWLVARTG